MKETLNILYRLFAPMFVVVLIIGGVGLSTELVKNSKNSQSATTIAYAGGCEEVEGSIKVNNEVCKARDLKGNIIPNKCGADTEKAGRIEGICVEYKGTGCCMATDWLDEQSAIKLQFRDLLGDSFLSDTIKGILSSISLTGGSGASRGYNQTNTEYTYDYSDNNSEYGVDVDVYSDVYDWSSEESAGMGDNDMISYMGDGYVDDSVDFTYGIVSNDSYNTTNTIQYTKTESDTKENSLKITQNTQKSTDEVSESYNNRTPNSNEINNILIINEKEEPLTDTKNLIKDQDTINKADWYDYKDELLYKNFNNDLGKNIIGSNGLTEEEVFGVWSRARNPSTGGIGFGSGYVADDTKYSAEDTSEGLLTKINTWFKKILCPWCNNSSYLNYDIQLSSALNSYEAAPIAPPATCTTGLADTGVFVDKEFVYRSKCDATMTEQECKESWAGERINVKWGVPCDNVCFLSNEDQILRSNLKENGGLSGVVLSDTEFRLTCFNKERGYSEYIAPVKINIK